MIEMEQDRDGVWRRKGVNLPSLFIYKRKSHTNDFGKRRPPPRDEYAGCVNKPRNNQFNSNPPNDPPRRLRGWVWVALTLLAVLWVSCERSRYQEQLQRERDQAALHRLIIWHQQKECMQIKYKITIKNPWEDIKRDCL